MSTRPNRPDPPYPIDGPGLVTTHRGKRGKQRREQLIRANADLYLSISLNLKNSVGISECPDPARGSRRAGLRRHRKESHPVVPENSIRRGSRDEGESSHHPARCLPSSN